MMGEFVLVVLVVAALILAIKLDKNPIFPTVVAAVLILIILKVCG